MAAGRYSFLVEQGATKQFEIIYSDSTGTPVDLTGYTAKMQIRPYAGSDEVYVTLTNTTQPDGTGLNLNGLSGNNPYSSGSIGVTISATVTEDFTFGEASYDLELTSGAIVYRILEGKVKLSKEVTK